MSKNKECEICRKTSIGGQALIEGVMMRGPEKTVMSVRTPDGSIVSEDVEFKQIKNKYPIFGLPLIRGVVNLIESMIVGYKTLMRSAELSGMTDLEDEEDKKKKENKTEEELQKDEKKQSALMSVLMIVASVLGVALSFFLFMYVPTLIFEFFNNLSGKSINGLRGIIEGGIKIIVFLVYMILVSRMKEIKRVFMYHGAEHKTIFCYEKNLPLTVEYVREQSRFHPRCGTSFMFLMIGVGIIFSTVINLIFPGLKGIVWTIIKILLVPVFCAVGYELIKICGKYDNILTKIIAAPGLWVQRITTVEPDDKMIEVSLQSFIAVLPEGEKVDTSDDKADL